MTLTAAFDELLAGLQSQKLPPVESWNPDRLGEIDIRIRADGIWFHEGREIKRTGISKIFSTILRREDDQYFLVTPVEKLKIEVEDVPFVAVDFEIRRENTDEQDVLFVTNLDDVVLLGKDHPLELRTRKDEVIPYIEVRNGLSAIVSRSAYYRLVDFTIERDEHLYLMSNNTTFALGAIT